MKFLASTVLLMACASQSFADPTDRPCLRMPAFDKESSVLFCPNAKACVGGVSDFVACEDKVLDCPEGHPDCHDKPITRGNSEGQGRKLSSSQKKRLTHAQRWENHVNRKNAEFQAELKNKGRKLQDDGPTSPVDGSRVLPDPNGPVLSLKANVGTAQNVKFYLQFPSPHDDKVANFTGIIKGDEATAMMSGLYDADSQTDPFWTWWVMDEDAQTQIGEKFTFLYGPENTEAPQVRSGLENQIDLKSGDAIGGGSTQLFEGPYNGGGQIQEAIGRLYYNIGGVDYACSGTAIHDNKTGRSIILTAAHCVYDRVTGLFATNALFIPNRDQNTMLDGEDPRRECDEDPCGCWTLSGGVVDWQYAGMHFPYEMNYDYGFYVVDDVGKHTGPECRGSSALDVAVLESTFTVGDNIPLVGEPTADFGYTLSYNPDLRFCEGTITLEPLFVYDENWNIVEEDYTLWNDNCGLDDGSSGGPWTTNFDYTNGEGPLVSVNSYSFTSFPGMGAPYFWATNVRCLMNYARDVDIATLETGGSQLVDCFYRACIDPGARRLKGDTRPECTKEDEAERK